MPAPLAFAGADHGPWRVDRIQAIVGDGLPVTKSLFVGEAHDVPSHAHWVLRGIASNMRYTHRDEAAALKARQPKLGRAQATCAALIPISKSEAWWALAQDERRNIFEERSRHIAIGMAFLPQIARRLLHGRDLGEPFDFLTWFEFAPEDETLFDQLLGELRASEEWRHVTREVDIRLTRAVS